MSFNRSLLSQITKDLADKKKPSKPNVPRNQWQHPGEITKVNSPNITMDGVSYPVLGVPNVGPAQMMYPDQQYNYPGANNVTEHPMMRNGGYTVTRSHDRKGKTHKVTGPDGTVKYFGDSKLGQHPSDPARKKAFYARHKKNLDGNPFFRAFARATWAEGGDTPAYQVGGETFEERVNRLVGINKRIPKITEDRNFVKTWNESPMAQQMLANSVDKDDPYGLNSYHADSMANARNILTDGAKVKVVNPAEIEAHFNKRYPDRDNSLVAGYYNKGKSYYRTPYKALLSPYNTLFNGTDENYRRYAGAENLEKSPSNITLSNNWNQHDLDQSAVHEFSHASDKAGIYMPQYDIDKIKQYSKGKTNQKFTKYVAEPTETRARLMNFRYNAHNQNLYDPFTQKATMDHLKNYKEDDRIDPLRQLRAVYNDKQILDLLNTVSYNEKNSEQTQARYGGEPDNVKKFMDHFHMKYGGVPYTTLAEGGQYQEGGEPVVDTAPIEYTGSSIVDYLQTRGFSGSKQFRKKLAEDMGIQGYNYSAKKNLELLNRLREQDALPESYQQEFTPVAADEIMSLEQQRGVYVPMPDNVPSAYAPPAPIAPIRSAPAPVAAAAPVRQVVSHPLANNSILRNPGPAAPANPHAGMYDPRVALNTVPVSAVPMPTAPGNFPGAFNQQAALQAIAASRGKVANSGSKRPVTSVPVNRSFPGMFDQQAAFAAIENAPTIQKIAGPGKVTASKKNVVSPIVRPEINNDVDETTEENGLAWYDDALNAFSKAVKKAPYDFSKIGMGSTGPNPYFDRDAMRHLITSAAGLVSPEKGALADNYFKRQDLKNNDNLQETKTKFNIPKTGLKQPAIITGDTIPINNNRYVIPSMIDLNQTKWGVRNRDEYKNINTEAADITTFDSFVNAKDYFKKNLNDAPNSTYVGVDPQGNVKAGNRNDFMNSDYKISKTFGNKIVDFVDEPNGSMKLKPTSAKASNRHLSPVVTVLGDDGKPVEGSMNLLIPKRSRDTKSFGQITGGRVIFKTPKGEQYLVSGSAEDIRKAFKQIKGNNPYVEAITLDNGSYAMGLRNKNQKITAQELRDYQGQNSTGSAFLYLQPGNYTRQSTVAPPVAAAPKFQFKDVQMKTPNIRTEKDESFKKGHPIKNEQKAIILHHTGYSDTTGVGKGMSAAMRGVNQQFSKQGESSHVVIDFDGTRYNYARPDQVTFHAGKSLLNGRDNVNDFGVGIEFQGDTDRKHLTDKQINSFVEYIAPIIKKNKIPLSSVVTHKMIRNDYMKSNPQDKDVYSKPDLNEYDYKRILKVLKDKKVYKFGGSTSGWLEKYN